MACSDPNCLKELVDHNTQGNLFKKKLSKTAFRCLLEVLKNARRKKLKKCFSRKTRKGFKTYKKLISKFVSKKISERQRREKFQSVRKNFQKWIRQLLADFEKNCLEENLP